MSDPLRGWYERAGVRGQARRILHEDREQGLVPFPEKEIPFLAHEVVTALPPEERRALVARHLYQYLQFTVHLETNLVNVGAAMVAHNDFGYPVPDRTRLDALKVYCDEGYHALYNLDVIQQVEQVTGTAAPPYDFGPRLERLDRTADRFLPGHSRLARVLQVVVFETVITSILSGVPHDPTVYRIVREVVADHARDEAYHHAFFVGLLRDLWTHLSTDLRTRAANAIPYLIDDCLRPDLGPVHASLRAAGLAPSLVSDVVEASYPEAAVRAAVRDAARHTIRLFDSVGAFDLPGARDRLSERGLG